MIEICILILFLYIMHIKKDCNIFTPLNLKKTTFANLQNKKLKESV